MQFSAEIWRPSENIHDIHALGDFSNLIGKSPQYGVKASLASQQILPRKGLKSLI